ncbi:hypothetical protein [Micromonospora lutea]|nr:hypothetical protein [Micromonospora lutea]
MPVWLMWYFASLTVLDPLAALLLALRAGRRTDARLCRAAAEGTLFLST